MSGPKAQALDVGETGARGSYGRNGNGESLVIEARRSLWAGGAIAVRKGNEETISGKLSTGSTLRLSVGDRTRLRRLGKTARREGRNLATGWRRGVTGKRETRMGDVRSHLRRWQTT